jgi:hypothetical protein
MTGHNMLSIETELKQIELATWREQLISVEMVEKDLTSIIVETRTRILRPQARGEGTSWGAMATTPEGTAAATKVGTTRIPKMHDHYRKRKPETP